MDSIWTVDAALKRVELYNPDLSLELLWLNEDEALLRNQDWEIAHVRAALVARVADIGWSETRKSSFQY
jgi:hypothetical protein